MKKIFALCMLLFCTSSYAQKVSDILEHGKVVKNKEGIFLQLQTDKIFFETGKSGSSNFDPFKSETFFLIQGDGANINITPLNPLNYSTAVEITFQPDAINAAAAEALQSILTNLGNLSGQLDATKNAAIAKVEAAKVESAKATAASDNAILAAAAPKDKKGNPKKLSAAEQAALDAAKQTAARQKADKEKADQKVTEAEEALECVKEKLEKLKTDFEALAKLLAADKKTDIVAGFKILKELDFLDKEVTKAGIDAAKMKRDAVDAYFKTIKDKMDAITPDIAAYVDCDKEAGQTFINVYVLNQMMKDAQSLYQVFLTRLSNLDKANTIVTKVYNSASGTGKDWYIKVKRVSMEEEKITSASVTINKDGYELSADNEIVKADKKELVSTTLKFRKFQRFVPEVSAGLAYTKLSFPKYATETDPATGKLRVADAGEEKFKQMNFTGMINFNYYFPNTAIHPFWQIGIGANADYPTFLTGIGFRLNVGLKRLAISTGFAGTWINTLQTFELGEEVESDAALQKDLKHEFSFPLKPYFGIQMNF